MSCFSLRGKYSFADNSNGAGVRIFDYVSPDRRRAWKVTRAFFWPITVRASLGGGSATRGVVECALMTDFKKGIEWNNILDPTENRSFGWGVWNGYWRENASSDFIVGDTHGMAEILVDPDTIITKELHIVMCSTTENDVSPVREWGYMIELEEMKVTPSESVFQQIKGMGQKVIPE